MDCQKVISTECIEYQGSPVGALNHEDLQSWLAAIAAQALAVREASEISADATTFLSVNGDGKPSSPLSWALLVPQFTTALYSAIETDPTLLERFKSILIGSSTREMSMDGVHPVRQVDVSGQNIGNDTFRLQWRNQASGDTYEIQTASLQQHPKTWTTLYTGFPAFFDHNMLLKVDIKATNSLAWRIRRMNKDGDWSEWSEQAPLIPS